MSTQADRDNLERNSNVNLARLIKAETEGRQVLEKEKHPHPLGWDAVWRHKNPGYDWNTDVFEYMLKPEKVVRYLVTGGGYAEGLYMSMKDARGSLGYSVSDKREIIKLVEEKSE